jgi:hypothetical protein
MFVALILAFTSSPSMDEATTKEELRPVKKQLVSIYLPAHSKSSHAVSETIETIGRGNAKR